MPQYELQTQPPEKQIQRVSWTRFQMTKVPGKLDRGLSPDHTVSLCLFTKDLSGQADRINIYNLFPLSGNVYREAPAQRPVGLQ